MNTVIRIIRLREQFNIGKLITFVSTMMLAMTLSSVDVSAQEIGKWIDKCNEEIGVPVPSFSCSQGRDVPKKITDGKCKYPEALYNRCVHKSKLGRLAKNNFLGVEIIFSCRKSIGGTHLNDDGANYYDIAVIQHNPGTGKTCFYQYLGNHSTTIPAAATFEGKKFWTENSGNVNYCTSCHTNGPFIRTPHYWNVKDKDQLMVVAPGINSDRSLDTAETTSTPTFGSLGSTDTSVKRATVLPDEKKITKYHVVHDHYEVFDINIEGGNGCTGCHNISAYRTSPTGKLTIGEVNYLAAGKIKKLELGDGLKSPTKSGYYDFMRIGLDGFPGRVADGYHGSRVDAVAELEKLEGCLKKPTPAGCTITPVIPEPDKYVIRSKYGCPGHKFCNAELSWDGTSGHPMASVEFNDRVEWELERKGNNTYIVKSTAGCPNSPWCRAELSWHDGGGPHPMASVEHNDTVLWEFVSKGNNRFILKSTYGCPGGPNCNAELSWDNARNHPMASVEFNDTVEWELIKKGDHTSNCKNYKFGKNILVNGQTSSRLIEGKITQPGDTIAEIINKENVDMVLSYYPKTGSKNPIKNVTIPAGKSSGKFFVLPGYGKVEIERRQEFFSSDSRKNGANIKVCFVDR
ncbi:MAG: hypothetical protein ACQ9MH_14310 [Nitrospinales bacterium]